MATLEEIRRKTGSHDPRAHAPDEREMVGPGEALERLRKEKRRVASGDSEAADEAPLVRNKQ